MSLPRVRAPAAVVLIALLAAPVAAHEAPPTMPGFARLVEDAPDDLFEGHDPTRDGHDLLALDATEVHDDDLGDALVLRLIFAGGKGPHSDTFPRLGATLTFDADGAPRAVRFETDDNERFRGTCDRYAPVTSATHRDGTPQEGRHRVDCTVALATLDLAPRATLSGFTLQGDVADAPADVAPGGSYDGDDYREATGDSRRAAAYVLQGAARHIRIEPRAAPEAVDEGETVLRFAVRNPAAALQAVSLAVLAPEGVDATLAKDTLDLRAGREEAVTLHVAVPPGTAGDVVVEVRSSLGGRDVLAFPLRAPAADATPRAEDAPRVSVAPDKAPPAPPADDPREVAPDTANARTESVHLASTSPRRDAPAAALPLVAALAAAAALARRR